MICPYIVNSERHYIECKGMHCQWYAGEKQCAITMNIEKRDSKKEVSENDKS